MRRVATIGLMFTLAGCDGGSSTPTSATDVPSPTPFAVVSCAPPTGARVHSVPVPGSSPPLLVWIVGITPPAGSTVRVGQFYQVTYGSSGPPGITAMVQAFVADSPTAWGGFASVTSGGCGASGSGMPIPRSDFPLRLYVRAWIRRGTVFPPDIAQVLQGPADYVDSDHLDWIVVP